MKTILFLLLFPLFAWGSPQGVPVMTEVTIATAGVSVQALPIDLQRGYMIMQNKGSSICQVSLGKPLVGLGVDGLFVNTFQNYEPAQSFVKSAVYIMCGAVPTTFTFAVTEF